MKTINNLMKPMIKLSLILSVPFFFNVTTVSAAKKKSLDTNSYTVKETHVIQKAVEEEMVVENWMISLKEWRNAGDKSPDIKSNQESRMKVESWMFDFEQDNQGLINPDKIKTESWMLNLSKW